MNNQVVCPLTAIKDLSGESLRVYLVLKMFAQQGYNKTVLPSTIAENLNTSENLIVLQIIHLCVTGWLKIDLAVEDFFDKEKITAVAWQINDIYDLTIPNNDFLNDAHNISLSNITIHKTDSLDEVKISIAMIKQCSKKYLKEIINN